MSTPEHIALSERMLADSKALLEEVKQEQFTITLSQAKVLYSRMREIAGYLMGVREQLDLETQGVE